jgi:bifunctional DNA-binding transcriptional regulator/antitoxin component of YhaV-PrlF toxin-antitoxin module
MKTFVVGTKGQITLNKSVMRHLGVLPGEKVILEKLPGGRVVLQAAATAGNAFGFLKKARGPSLSVEEIGALAAEGWAGKR